VRHQRNKDEERCKHGTGFLAQKRHAQETRPRRLDLVTKLTVVLTPAGLKLGLTAKVGWREK
jgi:hypothetical protein